MRADAASSGRWGEEVAELGPLADKLGGFARELLLGHGWSADHPDLVPFAGVDWQAELGDIVARTREGRLGMDFSDTLQDGPYPGSLPDIAQLTGDLGERVEEWERLPEGPERSRQAAVLMGTLSLTDPHRAHLSQEQRDRLAEAASAGPDGTAPDPGLRTQLEALLAMNALHSEQGAPGLDAILERMARARAAADPGTGKLLAVMEVLATARRAGASRTTDDLEEALRGWEELRPGHGLGEVLGELMDAQVTALVRLPLALRHRDLPAVDDCLGHLQETFDGLPPGHDAHAELASQLALARAQRDSLAASLGLPADDAQGTAPAPDVAEVREAVARLSRAERAAALASHASGRLAVLARDDGAGPLDEVEALFQEAYELVEEGSDDRLQHAFGLAAVHLLRAGPDRHPAPRAPHRPARRPRPARRGAGRGEGPRTPPARRRRALLRTDPAHLDRHRRRPGPLPPRRPLRPARPRLAGPRPVRHRAHHPRRPGHHRRRAGGGGLVPRRRRPRAGVQGPRRLPGPGPARRRHHLVRPGPAPRRRPPGPAHPTPPSSASWRTGRRPCAPHPGRRPRPCPRRCAAGCSTPSRPTAAAGTGSSNRPRPTTWPRRCAAPGTTRWSTWWRAPRGGAATPSSSPARGSCTPCACRA